MEIVITDKARQRLRDQGVGEAKFLRIGVISGGCAGMTYDAAIVDEPAAGEDVVCEEDGIKIVSDQRSTLFLDGLNIDYSDDLISAGFQLTNGNSANSCGCGASFSV